MRDIENLNSQDILDAFDRFRRDGNYSSGMVIDPTIVDYIVASCNVDTKRNKDDGKIRKTAKLMLGIIKAKPISTPPGEFTKPDHHSALEPLDKYAVANETFAFEIGLKIIGLGVAQIAESKDKLAGKKLIALLAAPDCEIGHLHYWLRTLNMSASP
jgi:hypothetical protein